MSPNALVAPPAENREVDPKAPCLAELGPSESLFESMPHAGLESTPESTTDQREWLRAALIESNGTPQPRKSVDALVSLSLHAFFLSLLLLLPLMFVEGIDLKQFTQTFLVAPPPPPPPPAVTVVTTQPRASRKVFMHGNRLLAPTVIPARAAILQEEPLPPDIGPQVGAVGGVPGGVQGGQVGGVLGGILQGAARPAAPLPPPPAPRVYRVGGQVSAPQVIHAPQPVYPTLAKAAKLEGDVVIQAIIDTSGDVIEVKAVSGHPLLITAALKAVQQWKYRPTMLNQKPVAVELMVTVQFRMR